MLARAFCLATAVTLTRALPSLRQPVHHDVTGTGNDAVLFESMATLRRPQGWVMQGAAPQAQLLELTFAIKQRNTERLETELMAAADPDSPSYGRWLSNEQVHEMVAPSTECTRVVADFLAQHGVTGARDASPNGDFVSAAVSVGVAEQVLRAQYHAFKHAPSGHVLHRALAYHLPADVASCVDFVSPTVHLPTIRARPSGSLAREEAGKAGRGANTPTSLRALYGVNGTKGDASKKTKQAVTAFLKQLYSASDLKEFYKKYWPTGDASIKQVGDAKPGRGGIESMLDIEYSTGMAGAVATEFWGFTGTAPDNKENEPFLKWLMVLASTSDADAPQLFSTSYGEDEDSVTPAYAARVVVEFQKAGARGISLLFASGDSGVGRRSGACVIPGDVFNSQWPAATPWVTAVGATEPYQPDSARQASSGGSTAESAAGLSSGGFSDRWPRAAWQEAAVAAYKAALGSGPPAAAHFNATGAGFPDISAQGVEYSVVAGGLDMPGGVAGTSCASPTAAGVFSLVNDQRLAAGKPALGFLNPLIYKNPTAFNDIDTGSNAGCLATTKHLEGFPALKGWDPATGLGTPNLPAMLRLLA